MAILYQKFGLFLVKLVVLFAYFLLEWWEFLKCGVKGSYFTVSGAWEREKNKNFDITPWLVWHLTILENSMIRALSNIDYLVKKTKFWDKHRDKGLNTRHIKVLTKVLDMGAENFEGGISTKKYISLTKVSKATAVRDISQLVEFGCIEQIQGSSGRNVQYVICE